MRNLESLNPITKDVKDHVLVIGGGIAGITAALEMTDDREVILIERAPYIGGQMIGLSKTFPTLDCSQCILTPKMVAVFNHPNITPYTQTGVASVDGSAGDYSVTLRRSPRYVDIEACTSCGRCAAKCPADAICLPFAGDPAGIHNRQGALHRMQRICGGVSLWCAGDAGYGRRDACS